MNSLQTASSSFMQKVYQQDASAKASETHTESNKTAAQGETIDAEFNEQDDQDKNKGKPDGQRLLPNTRC